MSERLAALVLASALAACAPELRPVSSEDVVFSAPSVRFPFLEVIDGVLYLSASLHKDEVRYPDEDAVVWPRGHRGMDHYLSSFVKTPHGVIGTAYITQRRDESSETVFSWFTRDEGRTWLPRAGVLHLTRPQKQRDANWGGFLMHRSMLWIANGALCGTAYGGYEDDAKYRSVWVCSADEGANWEVASTIAYSEDVSDEGYGEPVAVRVGETLVAVLRTGRGELRAARSGDGGASWSEPWPILGTFGAFDPELVVVGSVLLLLYGDGSSPIRVRSSRDGGVTWRALPDVAFDTKSSGYVGARVVGDQLLVVTDGHGETALVSKRLPLASLLPSEP